MYKLSQITRTLKKLNLFSWDYRGPRDLCRSIIPGRTTPKSGHLALLQKNCRRRCKKVALAIFLQNQWMILFPKKRIFHNPKTRLSHIKVLRQAHASKNLYNKIYTNIKNLYKTSQMFTIGQIRSFCERQEGYYASEIIDFLHLSRFQWNYNMRAIVKISPILYKFLIQIIFLIRLWPIFNAPSARTCVASFHLWEVSNCFAPKIWRFLRNFDGPASLDPGPELCHIRDLR